VTKRMGLRKSQEKYMIASQNAKEGENITIGITYFNQ
jgi:hypothetical protein